MPVRECEAWDALKLTCVVGDGVHAKRESLARQHQVIRSDRLTLPFEVPAGPGGVFSGVPVEGKNVERIAEKVHFLPFGDGVAASFDSG